MSEPSKSPSPSTEGDRVHIPLDPEDALRALLAVRLDAESPASETKASDSDED